MEDSTKYLATPATPDDSISQGFTSPLDLFNYLSPAAWLNALTEELTGTDVCAWAVEWLSGDWEPGGRSG